MAMTDRKLSVSPLPVYWDTRIERPVPKPRKMHRSISTGCALVPTAARDTGPQKFPITRVSTVLYSCCKMFPIQIGRANNTTSFMIEPFVISMDDPMRFTCFRERGTVPYVYWK